MEFKPGQEVVIKEAYVGGHDGDAIFVRECRQPENKGMLLVHLVNSIEMVVSPERVIDSQVYYKKKNGN